MARIGLNGQRWLKTAHVVFCAVWVGLVVGLLGLVLHAISALDGPQLHGYLLSVVFLDSLIIPAAMLTFLSGLMLSLLTPSGLTRYWWVLLQFVTAVVVIVLGAVWLGPAAEVLEITSGEKGLLALQDPRFVWAYRMTVGLGAFNVLLLVATVAVAVVRPWGKIKR